MAKKQTRRSISVSRTTYERLKAFCETNHISMSQLVETRVNDFLGPSAMSDAMRPDMTVASPPSALGPSSSMHGATPPRPAPIASPPAPAMASFASAGRAPLPPSKPFEARPVAPAVAGASPAAAVPAVAASPAAPPMTSAAARFAVDPPPPIIKPRQETAAPKPAEKRPDQIFTF